MGINFVSDTKILMSITLLLLSTVSSYAENLKSTATEISDWVVLRKANEYNDYVVSCTLLQGLKNKSAVIINYLAEQDVFLLSTHKTSWNIPDNTNTTIFMQFDNHMTWYLHAVQAGSTGIVSRLSELFEPEINLPKFADEFKTSKNLRIWFDGNEPEWEISLHRSGEAFAEFEKCVSEIINSEPFKYTPPAPKATQPFNDSGHNIPVSPLYPRPGG